MGSCMRSTSTVMPIPRLAPGAFMEPVTPRRPIQARSASDGIVHAIDVNRDAHPPARAGGFYGTITPRHPIQARSVSDGILPTR